MSASASHNSPSRSLVDLEQAHALDATAVLALLESDAGVGLDQAEDARRRAQYGDQALLSIARLPYPAGDDAYRRRRRRNTPMSDEADQASVGPLDPRALEERVRIRLAGRISDFCLVATPAGLVLQGSVGAFHIKQLGQEYARAEGGRGEVNEIVDYPRPPERDDKCAARTSAGPSPAYPYERDIL